MHAESRSRNFWPWVTTVVVGITAVFTAAQFIYPALLPAMDRRPDVWASRQYWRIISPLFVHSDGWKQIAFNFPAIACVGSIVEWVYGRRFWLTCYFLSGIVAELFAYVWQPTGAGASIAGAGLLGALAVFALLKVPVLQVKFGAVFALLGSVVLISIRDIHGPPVLTGAGIALAVMRRRNT